MEGDAAAIINECNAGRTFERNEDNQIVNYLEYLVNEWRINKDIGVRKVNYEQYSRYNQAKKVTDILLNFEK